MTAFLNEARRQRQFSAWWKIEARRRKACAPYPQEKPELRLSSGDKETMP